MPAQEGLGCRGDKQGNLHLMCYCELLWGCLCLALWLMSFLWFSKYTVPWITTCYTLEISNQWLKEGPQQQLCWCSCCRGEDYVTAAIFSGWAVIISNAPDHSVIQDALIYCQNEQMHKAVYVTKGLNSFFFTTLLARLPIAIQMGCPNMFCVLQSSVPTLLVLSLSFYCILPPDYDILNIQLAGKYPCHGRIQAKLLFV